MDNSGINLFERIGKTFEDEINFNRGFSFNDQDVLAFDFPSNTHEEQDEPIVDIFEDSALRVKKNDIVQSSPISNAYSLTIKGFGKKDNLRCTSNTKISAHREEESELERVEHHQGPRVERILFNNQNEHIFKQMPNMSLLIRSKGNSPEDSNHMVFEPFIDKSNSKRRIFQLSGAKRSLREEELEQTPTKSIFGYTGEKDHKEIKLRLNFDKTPTKSGYLNDYSCESSARKRETFDGEFRVKVEGEYDEDYNMNFSSDNGKLVAPSPIRRRSPFDNLFVTKRFKLGQFNYDNIKKEIDDLNKIKTGQSQTYVQNTYPTKHHHMDLIEKKSLDNFYKKNNPSKLEVICSKVKDNGEFEPRVIKCNCKNSKCLKLYCECFRNGRYCLDCNCTDCHNIKKYDDLRKRAVENIKQRNPNAFKPRIAVTKKGIKSGNLIHTKGCSCKKSGCTKKYCECFLNGVPCTVRCKCINCKNGKEIKPKNFDDFSPSKKALNTQLLGKRNFQSTQEVDEFDEVVKKMKQPVRRKFNTLDKENFSDKIFASTDDKRRYSNRIRSMKKQL